MKLQGAVQFCHRDYRNTVKLSVPSDSKIRYCDKWDERDLVVTKWEASSPEDATTACKEFGDTSDWIEIREFPSGELTIDCSECMINNPGGSMTWWKASTRSFLRFHQDFHHHHFLYALPKEDKDNEEVDLCNCKKVADRIAMPQIGGGMIF